MLVLEKMNELIIMNVESDSNLISMSNTMIVSLLLMLMTNGASNR